jgi:hypothetical protein
MVSLDERHGRVAALAPDHRGGMLTVAGVAAGDDHVRTMSRQDPGGLESDPCGTAGDQHGSSSHIPPIWLSDHVEHLLIGRHALH